VKRRETQQLSGYSYGEGYIVRDGKTTVSILLDKCQWI